MYFIKLLYHITNNIVSNKNKEQNKNYKIMKIFLKIKIKNEVCNN